MFWKILFVALLVGPFELMIVLRIAVLGLSGIWNLVAFAVAHLLVAAVYVFAVLVAWVADKAWEE